LGEELKLSTIKRNKKQNKKPPLHQHSRRTSKESYIQKMKINIAMKGWELVSLRRRAEK
jgi:hypothetical protein